MKDNTIDRPLMQRRHFIKLLSAATATALCSPLVLRTAQADIDDEAWKKEPAYGKTINIGYNGGLCTGTLGIAQYKGFYKDQGLDTKIIRMSTTEVDAVGTGKVVVAGAHIASMLIPTVNGVRVTFTSSIHTGCKALYVLNQSSIQNTQDLIGKTIAVPDGIGGSDQNITMRFLGNDQINPMQVKYKVADPGAAVLAMQNGEIQAALLGDPFAKSFMDNGTLRMIRSLTFDEDFRHEPCCIHAINRDFCEKNPIIAKKLTLAHEQAKKWVTENREEAVKIMLDNQWASGDFDTVLEIFKNYSYSVSNPKTEETLRTIIDDYKSFGLINKGKDTDAILKELWAPVLSS